MKEERMLNNFTLPCLLSKVRDNVGMGAMLKRITDDRKALVVDYNERSGCWLVAFVSDKAVKRAEKRGKLPNDLKDYKFYYIKNDCDWIVLTMGCDEVLVE